MPKKKIELEKLASELFQDITRAEMSLSIRPNVMAKLFPKKELGRFNGFFAHLFDATATHSFMLVARMFDEPTGRFSVTLESLVRRVDESKPANPDAQTKAVNFLAEIATFRKKIAQVRGRVFAHRAAFPGPLPIIQWGDLEKATDLAKKVLDWYGREFGHAYSYRVPGFDQDCYRFVESQLELAQKFKKEIDERMARLTKANVNGRGDR